MKKYEKPLFEIVSGTAEGVYAASGEKEVCRFGRKKFNPNADTCQACSQSGGVLTHIKGSRKTPDTSCIDNMPTE